MIATRLRVLLAALVLAFALPSLVLAMAPIEFQSEAEEARYRGLLHQLRCVMCQNQSLADSPADIAGDLRLQVLELVREGRSDAEIRTFLVERYGEFILYQPPMSRATWLLWFGPALVLVAGAVMVVLTVRRKSAGNARKPVPPVDEDEQEW